MEKNTTSADPWSGMLQEFEIGAARVIALLPAGRGSIRESMPRLFCREGRLYTFTFLPDAEINTLEYNFSFGASREAGSLGPAAAPAHLVICGRHDSGAYLEITGGGWLGHDDRGYLEGRFDAPPSIQTWARHEALLPEGSDSAPFSNIIKFPLKSIRRKKEFRAQ